MDFNKPLVPPGEIIKWGGFSWKPAPDDGCWFKWEASNGGIFQQVHEDDVPAEVYAEIAKRALLK